MKDENLPPLDDLLKPVSGKVMPKSSKMKLNGGEMTDRNAMALQRRANQRPAKWSKPNGKKNSGLQQLRFGRTDK
jgi:hypothetical protein